MTKEELLKQLQNVNPQDAVEIKDGKVKVTKRKLDPESDEWIQEAHNLALSYAPRIYPCQKCSYPVADGYCCTYCKDGSPERDKHGIRIDDKDGWI